MDYMDMYAEELVNELVPNSRIKKFLRNPDVIGAYAESTVIRFVKRMVDPLKVSTGAVISPELVATRNAIPQIDVIVWQPNPLPAIFTAGDFGLVPRRSVLGVLEVKRSTYSGIGAKIKSILDKEDDLTTLIPLVREGKVLFSSLGVVCVREKKESDTILSELIKLRRVVVLSELDDDGTLTPMPDQVMTLVNFLVSLRLKAKLADGQIEIDVPAR